MRAGAVPAAEPLPLVARRSRGQRTRRRSPGGGLSVDVNLSALDIPPNSPVRTYKSPVTAAALKLQRQWRNHVACREARKWKELARLERAAQAREAEKTARKAAREAEQSLKRTAIPERRVSFDAGTKPPQQAPGLVTSRLQSPSVKAAMELRTSARDNPSRQDELRSELRRTQTVNLTALLAEHLWQQVGIIRHSDAVSYADHLVNSGYETPEKFDRVDMDDLANKFGFKPGHIADIVAYRARKAQEALASQAEETVSSPPKQSPELKLSPTDGNDRLSRLEVAELPPLALARLALVGAVKGLRGVAPWLLIVWRIAVTALAVHAVIVARRLRSRILGF